MPELNIKPSHKPIRTYYTELEKYAQLGEENEGTVRAAFQNLFQHYCGQSNLTLLCEKTRTFSAGKGSSDFHQQCRASINPNLSIAAVEEMLI